MPLTRPSNQSLRIGLAVGVGHLLLVTAVWVWFASLTTTPIGVAQPIDVFSYTYPMNVWFVGTIVGLILLGMIPTVLFLETRLILPLFIVSLWFLWRVFTEWSMIQSSPYPVKWRPPLDLYVFGGVWALTASIIGGAVESCLRKLWNTELRSHIRS